MDNNFIPCTDRPFPDEYFLVELGCDTGRAKSYSTIVRRKFSFYLGRMADLFGPLNDYDPQEVKIFPDCKYRHYWKVKHSATEEVYVLYCCYGEWRIGGNNMATRLGELMQLLNPDLYAGFSEKSFLEITGRPSGPTYDAKQIKAICAGAMPF